MFNSPFQMFTKGILAGWLIWIMVWLLAATERSKSVLINLATYVIALSGFTHIIVDSAEALYPDVAGERSFRSYIFDFALPTLATHCWRQPDLRPDQSYAGAQRRPLMP